MIKEAKKLHVSKFFPEDKPGIRYSVPIFQRVYSWKKPQWDALLTDIWENEEGYFLGTVICIPESNGNKKHQMYRVIDGQQRLISLLLIYASINSLLRSREKTDNQSKNSKSHNSTRMKSLKSILVTKSDPLEFRIIPPREGSNREWYEQVMRDSLYGYDCNEKNLIYKAYDYFRCEISKKAEEFDKGYFREIAKLKRQIGQVLMVRIDVLNASDAYILFESLNNRGLPLSISDIIKNQILSRFDGNLDELEKQANIWQAMIASLGEDPNIQERFFRHYYNAFRTDFPQLYCDLDIRVKNIGRSKLIELFETLANEQNVSVCVKELSDKAKLYDSLIHPDHNKLKKCKAGLDDLDHVGAAPSYQLLMYLLSTKVTEDKLQQLIDFLVKFFVRRNLTDKPRSRDMDMLFVDQIELLRENPDSIDQVIENLKAKSASEDEFIQQLIGDVYEENRAACRFILCKIEASYYKGDESLPDLWYKKESKFRFEIEHVFPQGENIPPDWIKMIAGGDEKLAKARQVEYVHKLGNLTLTAYNKELRNWPFEKKRDNEKHGKKIGYRNGLFLNADLANEPDWTIEKIRARTDKLVQKAIEIFRFL